MTALKTYIVSAILAIVFNAQDTLWATPNHPFWHKGHYVEASALHAGDTIETLAGDYYRIQQIIPFSGKRRVYNFTVAENSNYYVGSRGILVHNDCFLKRLTDSPELMAQIDALPAALKGQFIQDFYEAGEDVIKVLRERPGCVRAWESLVNAPDWSRLNTRLLEKVSGESDEFIERVGEFYTTTMKNNTPAGFNGAGTYTNGVYFDDLGFPNFNSFNPIGSQHIFPNGTGVRTTDFKEAKTWLKNKPEIEDYLDLSSDQLGGSPFKVKIHGHWSEQLTWHHHENGRDLIPVLSEVHNTTKHIGGIKLWN